MHCPPLEGVGGRTSKEQLVETPGSAIVSGIGPGLKLARGPCLGYPFDGWALLHRLNHGLHGLHGKIAWIPYALRLFRLNCDSCD